MFKIRYSTFVIVVSWTLRAKPTLFHQHIIKSQTYISRMPKALAARRAQHTLSGLSSHLQKAEDVSQKKEPQNVRYSTRKRKLDTSSSSQNSESQLSLRSSGSKLSQKQKQSLRSSDVVIKAKKSSSSKQKLDVESYEKSPQKTSKVVKRLKAGNRGNLFSKEELQVRFNERLENLKKSMVTGTVPVFRILCDRYEQQRDEEAAAAMAKFLLNKFEFFGLKRPERVETWKDLWADVKKLSPAEKRTLACQAWYSPEREFQYFAIELLHREKTSIYDDLDAKDSIVQTLDFVRQFITHSATWWDTVDISTTRVIGPLVKEFPDELLPVMDEWNVSSCFWLRRASIIHQLLYRKDTDVDRLFRYCKKLAHEEEFFIRKAIGWALREYHKTDPEAVRNFVKKNKNILSPLSIREALKHDKQTNLTL